MHNNQITEEVSTDRQRLWQIWYMQTKGNAIFTPCDLHVREEHHGNKANRLW